MDMLTYRRPSGWLFFCSIRYGYVSRSCEQGHLYSRTEARHSGRRGIVWLAWRTSSLTSTRRHCRLRVTSTCSRHAPPFVTSDDLLSRYLQKQGPDLAFPTDLNVCLADLMAVFGRDHTVKSCSRTMVPSRSGHTPRGPSS